ncbi:DUF7490 domain-containing protein [Natrarchaeobaculum aegyptiacum]|uniref:DUF7490 domain-containing protein n=1 Tax=Natrarchaeobaculum aegyptiacum TaxID=745377 RepID=A0A2Z2HTN9_9EURY|nr:hypothetical protein [Natrarchaeobaculum aegyptiacum]ARS90569.1 hypothetical protein B1756_13100 [Natrarchaeobaculum aegyptiacum]
MNRESLLAIAALVVVVATLSTLLLGGAITNPDEPDAPREVAPSVLETTLAADEVSGETATLVVDTHLEARAGHTENATLVHRATNGDTGLVEDTTTIGVDPIDDGAEEVVTSTIDVPRDGSHEIETLVYVDGTRTDATSYRVSGMDSLPPTYADSSLDFHRFGDEGYALADVPALEYTIQSADGQTAHLEVASYLTNGGEDAAGDLELEVKARQADSNIVADRETVPVEDVDPGETVAPTTDLEVPDEYRYHLDAILWRDGSIVATERAGADLRPESVVENASDADERGLDATDFEETDGVETVPADDSGPVRDDVAEEAGDGTPGFGPLGAAVAVAVGLALVGAASRRRKRPEPNRRTP